MEILNKHKGRVWLARSLVQRNRRERVRSKKKKESRPEHNDRLLRFIFLPSFFLFLLLPSSPSHGLSLHGQVRQGGRRRPEGAPEGDALAH